jgi:cyclic pyranopterin phosphate synthase
VDARGRAAMVDVGRKAATAREALASGRILLAPATLAAVRENTLAKGDVLAVARFAGIQGAKEASRLVPLCHPLRLDHVEVEVVPLSRPASIRVEARARTRGPTGVEMEALTAVSVALLTVYDMVKAVDRSAEIGEIRLERKSGGRSGTWRRDEPAGAARGRGRPPREGRRSDGQRGSARSGGRPSRGRGGPAAR